MITRMFRRNVEMVINAYAQWKDYPAPTFNVTYFDNGAGGQPTVSECRYLTIGKVCIVHLRGTGVKAGSNVNIVFADTGLPLINRAKYTGRAHVGSAFVYAAADVHGEIIHYSDNNFYVSLASVINDNVAIDDFTFTLTYELA